MPRLGLFLESRYRNTFGKEPPESAPSLEEQRDLKARLAEERKAQGRPEPAAVLEYRTSRREELVRRFEGQEKDANDRSFRLELLKREMLRDARLENDLRERLTYLKLGLPSPVTPPLSVDPALQRIADEMAELKTAMRKLAEAKK